MRDNRGLLGALHDMYIFPRVWGVLCILVTPRWQISKSPRILIYDMGVYQESCKPTMPQRMRQFVCLGDQSFKVSTYPYSGGGGLCIGCCIVTHVSGKKTVAQ